MTRRRMASLGAAVVLAALATVAVVGARGGSPAPGSAAGVPATGGVPQPDERLAIAACPAPGVPATGARVLPDLVLPCLSASGPAQVPLRRLTGVPTVLNLWAAWCGPCRDELPAFQRLAARAGGRVRVLGVLTDDAADDGAQFLHSVGGTYGSLFDRNRLLLDQLGRTGLPVTVLLDAQGGVRRVYQGAPLTDRSLAQLVRDDLGVSG